SDLFGDEFLFGGRRENIVAEVTLSFLEAARGAEKSVTAQVVDACASCRGSGGAPDAKARACHRCRGHGRLAQQVLLFTQEVACPDCGGRGRTFTTPCPECGGQGAARYRREIALAIPAGVRNNTLLALDLPGEQRVLVRVESHPLFERHGAHLIVRVPVPFSTAALGGKVDIPTVAGVETLDVPAGACSGDSVRLAGRGLPDLASGGVGDQIVQFIVEASPVPDDPTRALLERMRRLELSRKAKPETSKVEG
ncbi:MAG: molecular chaperone DnaJ, partial [Planctomycetes bacterium]|nr:molecular chaperone DnaJ [Planctomycetota bacterium]